MSFSAFDHQCMAEALRLANMGLTTSRPNPRVGCVIARDETVVGRGFHKRAGEAHAEVNALRDAGTLAEEATAYVTLEPCSHHGRTPPCADALIQAGIRRVVMACKDPFDAVNGSGRERLEQAGIEVESGLMRQAAEALNPGFLCRVRHGRPFVRVKLASSTDGRTALRGGESQWITGEEARQDVQRWRARSCAILTGIGTVLHDDPRMTVRSGSDSEQPLRVIADSHWRTPPGSRILNQPGETLVMGDASLQVPGDLQASAATCVGIPVVNGQLSLPHLLQQLADREINEVQVEAGAILCGSLLKQGLADEVLLYQAPSLLGEGGAGLVAGIELNSMKQKIGLQLIESVFVGNDIRLRYRLENSIGAGI